MFDKKIEARIAKLERYFNEDFEDYEEDEYYDDSCRADLKKAKNAFLDFEYQWSGHDDDKFNKLINDIKNGFAKLDAYIVELEQDY